MVSGLISTFTESIAAYLGTFGLTASASTALVWIVDALFSIALLWLLFATLIKILPDAKVQWKDVRVGALFTAVLFVIGKLVFGRYVGQSNPGEAFGAAGALAVILVFIYYALMVVLLGAEFTQVWAKEHRHRVLPARHAVTVVERREHVRDVDGARSASAAGTKEMTERRPQDIVWSHADSHSGST